VTSKPSRSRARELATKVFSALLNILYPRRCPSCRAITKDDSFCPACWVRLLFIENPCCFVCGEPLDTRYGGDLLCAACLKGRYNFDRLLSVFIYNKTIARAIYRFKFKRQAFLSKFFLKFLLKKLEPIKSKVDLIIPIPIHRKRLKWRGYNQTLLLARDISRETSIGCIPDLLLKNRHTVAQTTLRFRKRKSNLRSAFEINPNYLEPIRGKNIMIVDDIFTTGSTVNECAKILKKNGVGRVFILTIARTLLNKKYRTPNSL
jgi:ComF family protein